MFLKSAALVCVLFSAFATLSHAAPMPVNCNTAQTLCYIPPDVQLQLPYLATAGDIVLLDSVTNQVDDVFRIFNNFVNTGLGTGLGNLAFLYTAADSDLPAASSYSANVVFGTASTSGVTLITTGGHQYLVNVPEPQSLTLLGFGCLALLWPARKRTKFFREK